MTVRNLIEHLSRLNPQATVWVSDQQGGGGECNPPYEVMREPYEFYSGEVAGVGDVIMSYENT